MFLGQPPMYSVLKQSEGEPLAVAPRRSFSNRFLLALTLFFATLSGFLFCLLVQYQLQEISSSGFKSDLYLARDAIGIKEVTFTGSPAFDDEGKEYLMYSPDDTRFVGPPTPSIDAAWASLVKDRWFNISEEEAQRVWGDGYEAYRNPDGFMVGIEVFHVLHCLNLLRKTIDHSYYKLPADSVGRTHVDHCIDAIRQSVQCHADFTPIPTKFWPSVGLNVMDTNRAHTCRDFQRLREWTSDRAKISGVPNYEKHLPHVPQSGHAS